MKCICNVWSVNRFLSSLSQACKALFNFIKPQSNHCIYTRKMSKRGQQERLNRSCICLNRNQRSRKNSVFEEQNLIHCFNVTGTAPCEYITNICSGIQYPLTYFLHFGILKMEVHDLSKKKKAISSKLVTALREKTKRFLS